MTVAAFAARPVPGGAPAGARSGKLPTLDTIVFERFFDDVGDTHLVIHSTYGSRVNRAWGLALRKRFCRQFNFELQASALEDSIVLSLGPTHSFPLEDVKDFLKSATAKDVLVQALLDAPMFGTRWRWDASIALALPPHAERQAPSGPVPARGFRGPADRRVPGPGRLRRRT